MTREELIERVMSWDPSSGEELPDEVADALETDEAVRAAFESRFARVDLSGVQDVEAPASPTTARSARRWTRPVALAASAFIAVGAGWTAVWTIGASLGEPNAVLGGPERLQSPGASPPQEPLGTPASQERSARSPRGKQVEALGHAELADDRSAPTIHILRGPTTSELRGGDVLNSPAPPPKDVSRRNRATDLPARRPYTGPTEPVLHGQRHDDPGVHPVVSTRTDPFATFGLDVDTASWPLARASLASGYLPAPAAVRVEDFVNRLPYTYPRPPVGQPFAVHAEASPSPWSAGRHLVRVGVQARDVSTTPKAVHLTFLIDTSGSMSDPDKLPLVKQALTRLVQQLDDGDTVAIVAYAGAAGLVLPPTPISQRDQILSALERLSSGGSTAMGAGIQLAYDLALQRYQPGAVNRVVLASDGDANVGPTKHGPLVETIRYYADQGITLTAVGVGSGGYNGSMMENLAQQGDGLYAWLDGPAEAERVFVEQLTATMEVVARDAKAQVVWNPDRVRAWRQLGYENRDIADRDFRNDRVDAGEIGSGHQVTVIYEVELVPGSTGPLGHVSLRAKPPGPDAPASEWRYALPGSVVRASFEELSADTRMAAAAAGFAEVLRGSEHARQRSLAGAAERVISSARAGVKEDAELVEMARRAAGVVGAGALRGLGYVE
jgi:Ca-activated chloride channel family protein